jgi:hypothetical protein
MVVPVPVVETGLETVKPPPAAMSMSPPVLRTLPAAAPSCRASASERYTEPEDSMRSWSIWVCSALVPVPVPIFPAEAILRMPPVEP